MRKILYTACGVVFSLFSSQSLAAAPKKPTTEALYFTVPPSWIPALRDEKEDRAILEFVPPGRSIYDWDRMLVVRMAKQSKEVPEKHLDLMAEAAVRSCHYAPLGKNEAGKVNNYPAAMRWVACAEHRESGKGEFTLFQAIKGKDAFYVVQMVWRGKAFSGEQPPIAIEEYKAWQLIMSKVWLCDSADPAHPCPEDKKGGQKLQ
jgi:hypothetical protein